MRAVASLQALQLDAADPQSAQLLVREQQVALFISLSLPRCAALPCSRRCTACVRCISHFARLHAAISGVASCHHPQPFCDCVLLLPLAQAALEAQQAMEQDPVARAQRAELENM